MRPLLLLLLLPLQLCSLASAGQAAPPRTVPRQGVDISPAAREELERGAQSLGREIEFLEFQLREKPALHQLLPDVRILHKAVDWALRYDEFFRSNEVGIAQRLLQQGFDRCTQLRQGTPAWTSSTGLVVRGFISRLDGSIQPYGLVVPATWSSQPATPRRLDVWLHGRDNDLTELKFLNDRQRSIGEFAPADTLVLHPYGRYCNAFKFAGEVDVFEAMDAVQRHYRVDDRRIVIRGFSMGGAGCWHLATHHAGRWAAAAPGAGFAETAQYTGILDRVPQPQWFEQRLWRLYDATAYSLNLFQCPTIAYSGELDKQRQAADVMTAALKRDGLELPHLIGPGVGHQYERSAKQQLAARIDEAAGQRRDQDEDEVRFTTSTLRYSRMRWVTVDGLQQHWQRATVDARRDQSRLRVRTTNVTSLILEPGVPKGSARWDLEIDGQAVELKKAPPSGVLPLMLHRGRWRLRPESEKQALRKRPGLQGPIDDAFMDAFLFVRPTGRPLNEAVGKWVEAALARATNEWRAQFRGELAVKDDRDVTADDLRRHHLVLWGDPQSNRLLRQFESDLPVRWTASGITLGGNRYPADFAAVTLIYPSPAAPDRYVVLNSGFTFWAAGADSNARQTPKLPDYAILDTLTPPERVPDRGVVAAGFFDESWKVPRR